MSVFFPIHRHWRLLCAIGLCLPLTIGAVEQATHDLLVEAVTAAFKLDLYNARCRGDVANRSSAILNRELIRRYRLTLLGVQDDLFAEGDYRDARARMEQDFLAELNALGGCAGAKQAGWPAPLQQRYQRALEQIRQSH